MLYTYLRFDHYYERLDVNYDFSQLGSLSS